MSNASSIRINGTDYDILDAGAVRAVAGKGLSTNDYTDADKAKLGGIEAGAEANVNADWNAASGDAQILNKPTTLTGYGIQATDPILAGMNTDAMIDRTAFNYAYMLIQAELRDVQKRLATAEAQIAAMGT